MNKNFLKFFALSCLITVQTVQAPVTDRERAEKVKKHTLHTEGDYRSLTIPDYAVNVGDYTRDLGTPYHITVQKNSVVDEIIYFIKHIKSPQHYEKANFENFSNWNGNFGVLSYGVDFGGRTIHVSMQNKLFGIPNNSWVEEKGKFYNKYEYKNMGFNSYYDDYGQSIKYYSRIQDNSKIKDKSSKEIFYTFGDRPVFSRPKAEVLWAWNGQNFEKKLNQDNLHTMIRNINNYFLSVAYSADFESLRDRMKALYTQSKLDKDKAKKVQKGKAKKESQLIEILNTNIKFNGHKKSNDKHKTNVTEYAKDCDAIVHSIFDRINKWEKELQDIKENNNNGSKNDTPALVLYEQCKYLKEKSIGSEKLVFGNTIKEFQDTIQEIEQIKFDQEGYISLNTYRDIFKEYLKNLQTAEARNEEILENIDEETKKNRNNAITNEKETIIDNIVEKIKNEIENQVKEREELSKDTSEEGNSAQEENKTLENDNTEKPEKDYEIKLEDLTIEKIRKILLDYNKLNDLNDLKEDLWKAMISLEKTKEIQENSGKEEKIIEAIEIDEIDSDFLSDICKKVYDQVKVEDSKMLKVIKEQIELINPKKKQVKEEVVNQEPEQQPVVEEEVVKQEPVKQEVEQVQQNSQAVIVQEPANNKVVKEDNDFIITEN